MCGLSGVSAHCKYLLLEKFTSCDEFDLLSYMQSADLLLYIISDYSFGNSLESKLLKERTKGLMFPNQT